MFRGARIDVHHPPVGAPPTNTNMSTKRKCTRIDTALASGGAFDVDDAQPDMESDKSSKRQKTVEVKRSGEFSPQTARRIFAFINKKESGHKSYVKLVHKKNANAVAALEKKHEQVLEARDKAVNDLLRAKTGVVFTTNTTSIATNTTSIATQTTASTTASVTISTAVSTALAKQRTNVNGSLDVLLKKLRVFFDTSQAKTRATETSLVEAMERIKILEAAATSNAQLLLDATTEIEILEAAAILNTSSRKSALEGSAKKLQRSNEMIVCLQKSAKNLRATTADEVKHREKYRIGWAESIKNTVQWQDNYAELQRIVGNQRPKCDACADMTMPCYAPEKSEWRGRMPAT